MTEADRLARIAWNLASEPGDPWVTGLISAMGAEYARTMALEGDPPTDERHRAIYLQLAEANAERALQDATALGLRFVIPGDTEWPVRLDKLIGTPAPSGSANGVPLGLWVRGPLQLNKVPPSVAIVGARSSTTYGESVASDLAAGLARQGYTVNSGGAFGIDVAAHRGAIANGGHTVAVLACGADRAYPAAHKGLLDHIAEVGAVVSEQPPGTAPMRARFLARNRLIAGLSDGTVLVEAAQRSGSMNTAHWTINLMRPLGCVPGPVTSATSVGTHDLIRSGHARLVTTADQVAELLINEEEEV